MRIGRETEMLGENLPQCHFVHHKSHMSWPGLEPGPPLWEEYIKLKNSVAFSPQAYYTDRATAACRRS
jgi:hypothetical protein